MNLPRGFSYKLNSRRLPGHTTYEVLNSEHEVVLYVNEELYSNVNATLEFENSKGFENVLLMGDENREKQTISIKNSSLEIIHKNDNPAFDDSSVKLRNDVFSDEVSLKFELEKDGGKIASERNEYSGLDNEIRSIKGEVIISGSFIKNNNSIVDSKVTDSTLDCCNINNVDSVIYYSGFGETVKNVAQLTGGENNTRDIFRKYTKAKVIDDKKCGDLEL